MRNRGSKILRQLASGWLLVAILWPLTAVAAAATEKPGNVELSLLADRTAATPGQTVSLALRFQIEPGWHIYWRSSGLDNVPPPNFQWRLPPGFKVGPVQFPPPESSIDQASVRSYILQDAPTLLTSLSVPDSAKPGETIEIGLDANLLVCKQICRPLTKKVSLRLPIVADAAAAKPVDEAFFRAARAELPSPAARPKYLKAVSALANVDKVKPGEAFKVAVILQIQDGFHLNAHEVLSEIQIPTELFADATDGLVIGQALFPRGLIVPAPIPGEKLALYHGQVAIIVPVEPDPSLSGKSLRIGGMVTYQTCNDKTQQCFPRTGVEWSVTLPVAAPDEAVAAANAKVFQAAEAALAATATQPALAAASGAPSATQPAMAETAAPRPPAAMVEVPSAGENLYTSMTWLGRLQAALARLGLAGYLILALLGGFLLNLMPCVLPVISIKIVSFVQQARHSRLKVFTLGMAFSLGIFLSFVMLGILIVSLKYQWGGLFQNPRVVIGLAAVVTAFALSLFGVYTLMPPRFVNELGTHVPSEGHLGAFGMGLLATVLGTACTAPLLSVAVTFAARQTTAVGMLIFIVAGIGMSLPYVLLAAHPAWLRVIPKPGPWMETFEQAMGFLLLLTVVWLLNTVNEQLGGAGLLWTLVFLLTVAIALWFYGRAGLGAHFSRKAYYYTGAAIIVLGGWILCFHQQTTIDKLLEAQRTIRQGGALLAEPDWSREELPYIPYSPERVRQAVESGWTVFIDYTASWCVNCKANEKAVINTTRVREVMQRLGVLPFKADYTTRDPRITADLERYGRAGVPMYLVIPAGRPGDVQVLDEILTPASLIGSLERAGPSASRLLQVERSGRAQAGGPSKAGAGGL